ncbi:hypothetical protein GCM10027406_25980 [Leifsonia lichenia]
MGDDWESTTTSWPYSRAMSRASPSFAAWSASAISIEEAASEGPASRAWWEGSVTDPATKAPTVAPEAKIADTE